MSASYNAVTVTTTATKILDATPGRRGFVIANNVSNILYLGLDSSVTSSNGIQLMPQDKWDSAGEHSVFKGAIYGITSTSTMDARYWDWTA